ncbi:hypothetical protein HY285_03680 [Candidatus Peregrinibacteria bacterium]|nr:hypothetical protein [Candidatus Peregrinibacteria bacterium]MBI3816616.1 hypothetical protein [Candidatus Peregrinibacteria bacterium]
MPLPPPLSWLWTAWKKLGEAMGFVMSRILLTILWIVGFGIYAVIMKIVNIRRPRAKRDTEWIDLAPSDAASMRRQF